MRTLFSGVLLMAALVAPVSAQDQPPPAPPATDASAASLTGKWTMTSDAQSSNGPSVLNITQAGTKITGSITGAERFAITGEYTGGTLTFAMDYQGQLTVAFTGTLQPDGALAGTMDYGQGPVAWRAERIKE